MQPEIEYDFKPMRCKKNWVNEYWKKLFTAVEIPNLLPRNFFCIFKNIVLSGWDLSRELCFCFFHIRIFYAKLEFRPRPYQTRKNPFFLLKNFDFQRETILKVSYTLETFHHFFLDASSHLYKRVCPSIGPSIGPSVRPSVCPSTRIRENAYF